MKKYLLGSTALAATLFSGAAMAEEPIQLSLGGYFQAYGIHQNSDASDLRGAYIAQRGRLSVKGSTTLDNGITAGVYTQIRAGESTDQSDADGTIKRAYGFFEGSFGRFEIGSNDSAAMAMGYASPDPAPSAGVNSANFYANPPASNLAGALGSTPTTYQNWDGQNTKIAYFTPRIAGFQFGASYTPDGCQTGPSAGGTGCPEYGQASPDNDAGQYSEVYSFGANYSNTFNSVDVGVSATYQTATLEAADVATNALDDRSSYSFGTNLGYQGFTLGASYLHDDQGAEGFEVDAWDVGVKYTTGPWSAGVQYIQSTRENAEELASGAAGDHEVTAYMVGGGYALGPGINVGVGYQQWSWDAPVADGQLDADMILIGTVLNF